MFDPAGHTRLPCAKVVLSAVFLLTLGVITAPALAATAAGATPGTFAVSPTGAATYTIPIWAPRGPNGLQPHIGLTYNSEAGNGPFGVGWGLSGLGSIYRCSLTFAQDAAPAPVALITSDGYCLDGQRLRLTSSGNYGLAGSTYQTEIANFVNVTAYGTAGNGPAYFTAQDRNGTTYTYGKAGNSQVLATGTSTALSWQLNEVSDPSGNTMMIAYSAATGSAVPATISWTPSAYGSSTYNYTMTFAYGTNVAPPQGYVGGTVFKNPNLLSSITVSYSGTTVKKYVLTYQASSTTGRDELTQVQECADSGATNCLSPTKITYQSGAAGVTTSAKTAISGGTQVQLRVNYDFNGDGYRDLAYCNGGSPNIVYVAFGAASGYGTPVNTGIGCGALYGDLKGAGKDGLLAPNGSIWYYYSWNGSSFTGVSTGLAYDSTAAQYLLADVNGDGLPDLISSYVTCVRDDFGTDCTLTVYTRLNTTPAGGAPTFASVTTLAYDTDSYTLRAAQLRSEQQYGPGRGFDFNGDGRQDLSLQLLFSGTTYTTYELISTGSTFTSTLIASTAASAFVPVLFLNFNSDACTDYLVHGVIYISGCNGSVPTTVSLGSANVIGAMDWNGDGFTDVLVQNGSTIGVYESTGGGLSSLVTSSIPYSANNQYLSFDADGDGLDDLGVWVGATSVTYYLHNGAGQPPDLVSSVTDGFGNSATPTYVSLVQNNYTLYSDATYPDENYIGPKYVVNNVTFSDPSSASGGTYSQSFWYYGAWANLRGRGFESFYAFRTFDSRNGLYDYQYFERGFPYTGMQFEDIVSNGTFYPTQWVSTLASLVTLSSTQYQQRYFPYFNNTTATQKEVGGAENGDLITTTSINYTFDNYGNATSIARTVTDNDPGSPYRGYSWTTTTTNTPDVDTTHWCLGLLTETQVGYTSTLSGSNSVTRTKTLTPDTTHCRYTQIITEPSSPQFKVTEDLTYDNFGNVATDKLTGVGMGTASPASRTTTINWTTPSVTTGQFPMSVTDPSGAQPQFNYNFGYGVVSSTTDPNSLTTSWQYTDGFGRRTQENRPDGTYTKWAYTDCASSGCLVGGHGLDITQSVYAVGAAVITDGTMYLDPIGRVIVSNKRLLANGSYSRNEVRYDSLGRKTQQAMPCTWTSLSTTCPYWSTNTYDVLDRVRQSQRPISSTNSTLQTTTYAYAGRTTTVTDAQTNAQTTVTDVNGWPRQTKDPYGYYITTTYDAAGSKTGVTDSLGNTLWSGTYNYGLAPFPATTSDMDLGNWSYTVDALGEATAWRDAKGRSFSATYDAISRLLTRSEPDFFTRWTWGSSASSHNIGKLQSVCTGTGTNPTTCSGATGSAEAETYDSTGRLYQRAITLPALNTFTYTWQYNATTGLLDTLTYPVSTSNYALQLKYGYSNGIQQSVTDVSDTPNVTVWQANTTNPAGQVTQDTLGNGIVTNRSYDAVTHWLGAAQSGVGGGAGVKNLGFLYDLLGNVTQRQDNNLGLTENVYYDNDYRFSYSKLNGTQNLSVTYDNTGNITSRSDIASGASWTYDPVHKHAVTQAGSSAYQYSYDANGNAMTRQGSSIVWSSYNYPTSVSAGSGSTAETVSFAYGPARQRWQQSYSGNGTTETTYYVGGLLEVAITGSADYRHYIYAGGEAVAVYSRKSTGVNTLSYLLSDHQGGVASITNSSGAQVIGESFTAFGNRRNPSTWSGPAANSDLTTIAGLTRQGYTFQTALGLWMGLNHMNGRVQDAVTGRFLSADPNITGPANTQRYNRYSYVNNNPLSYTDPSGFADESNIQPQNGLGGGDFSSSSGGGVQEVVVTGSSNHDSPFWDFSLQGLAGVTTPDGGGDLETVLVTGHKPPPPRPKPAPPPQKIPCLPGVDCYVPLEKPRKPFKKSVFCNALQSAAANHASIAGDVMLSNGEGAAGLVHVSVSPESVNIFVGGGPGGGGRIDLTVGPAYEQTTSSVVGLRTFFTAGGGNGFGGALTITAGSNGADVSIGPGLVEGLGAATGFGFDLNIPISLFNLLCN